jgi:hypothetical protein
MPPTIPSEDEVIGWAESFKNWGRWGPDDELGTLNFVTAEKRRRAARLVEEGISVSCARPISLDEEPHIHPEGVSKQHIRTHFPTHHFMLRSGEAHAYAGGPAHFAADSFLIAPHGFSMTHLDGLSHAFWKGFMYNGRPAHLVATDGGPRMARSKRSGMGSRPAGCSSTSPP